MKTDLRQSDRAVAESPRLTAVELCERLHYNPGTGVFTWRSGQRAGLPAGFPDPGAGGYVRIMLDQSRHQAHRLAWLYMHGAWPARDLDHINGDRTDNRIANLREVSPAQNQYNGEYDPALNKTGRIGVHASTPAGRFRATIYQDGKAVHLGMFNSAEEAAAARVGAVKVSRGDFAFEARDGAPADARSDDRIQRMKDAIEGECNGLAITDDHAKAILEYVGAQLADEQFERGRREGMEKERALWNRWLRGFGAQVPAAQLVGFVKNFERSLAAMQHPSGGDQRTEGSGSSDRAQAQAVQRPVDGDGAN